MSYYNELIKFIKVSDRQVTGKGTVGVQEFNQERKPNYNDLKVEAKFGTGLASAIPWIAFLSENDTVQDGIYPVYLHYKEKNILILAYGVSETKEPNRTWNLQKGIKINQYFLINYSQKAEKYGDSFVYKVYHLENQLEKKEVNDDLDALIAIYKSTLINSKVMQEEEALKNVTLKKRFPNQIPFEIKTFQAKTKEAGLIFSYQLIQRFVASLCTKPFVICSGLSGSGKTKLAQAFAQWICESEKQYKIIPVGADWTNREPLLGYPNGLEPEFYVTPDSGALQLILEASKEENHNKPYFMILDEMNLSHVERYFADFLSIMESGDSIKLYSGADRVDSDGNKIVQEIIWPKNLFIIGTVNIDETTYMFSPKVLDRANVIEFRISENDMAKYLEKPGKVEMKKLFVDEDKDKAGKGASLGVDFMDIYRTKHNTNTNKEILTEFFKELQQAGAEFGYRSASEINELIGVLEFINKENTQWDEKDINKPIDFIDIAIMQKLLPKLHGSRKKLVGPLEILAGFCLARKTDAPLLDEQNKTKTIYQQFIAEKRDLEKWLIKYPISFEKIERMRKNVIENGFTSYAEA